MVSSKLGRRVGGDKRLGEDANRKRLRWQDVVMH